MEDNEIYDIKKQQLQQYKMKLNDFNDAKKILPKGSFYDRDFKGTKKTIINKKGVFHLKALFDIQTELIEYEVFNNPTKGVFEYCYHVYKAIAPNGDEAIGFGGADRKEFNSVHNCISTSSTRAELRAILELIGFGTLSEDELKNVNSEAV